MPLIPPLTCYSRPYKYQTKGQMMLRLKMGPDNQTLFLTQGQGVFNISDWEIEDRNGPRHFRGRLIGFGSSRRDEHSHPTSDRAVISPRQMGKTESLARCTACRWSEIYVFEIKTASKDDIIASMGAKFCVYTLGPSIIPGENTRANARWATSGFEVMEHAVVRRGDRHTPFLPAAHARALAMAADVNDDVAEAYVNRAVA